MENFITIDMFLSLAGCITIVSLLVQIFKQYIKLNPQWLNLIFSTIVCTVRIFIVGDFTALGIILGIFNILPILLGASGGYEVVKAISKTIQK